MTSGGYRQISKEEARLLAEAKIDLAWQNLLIPERQWDVIAKERKAVEEGRYREVAPYRAFIDALDETGLRQGTLVDIGASSGFYKRLIESAGLDGIQYLGVDYSEAFRDFAAKMMPDVKFKVADARNLPFSDASFDIAVSSCCMLHISNWQQAMRESVRVSKKWVIMHRTPIVEKETQYWYKEAYGIPCVEIWFGDAELSLEMRKCGLELVKNIEVFKTPEYGHYTLVCRKANS